jgi:hypothetical protein
MQITPTPGYDQTPYGPTAGPYQYDTPGGSIFTPGLTENWVNPQV